MLGGSEEIAASGRLHFYLRGLHKVRQHSFRDFRTQPPSSTVSELLVRQNRPIFLPLADNLLNRSPLTADGHERQRKQRRSICHVGICQTECHRRTWWSEIIPIDFPTRRSCIQSPFGRRLTHTTFDFDSITPHRDELSQSAS